MLPRMGEHAKQSVRPACGLSSLPRPYLREHRPSSFWLTVRRGCLRSPFRRCRGNAVPQGAGGVPPPPGAALGGGGTLGAHSTPFRGSYKWYACRVGSAKRGRRPKAVGAGSAARGGGLLCASLWRNLSHRSGLMHLRGCSNY